MKSLIKTSKVLILAIAVLTIASFAQAAWDAPSGTPSASNNAPTPINVSTSQQDKAGKFTASVVGADSLCLTGAGCLSEWPGGGAKLMKLSWSADNGIFLGEGISSVTGSSKKYVTFTNPMSDVNYAVVCNGTMSLGAELQLYSYNKTVDGFMVSGAHAAGADPINYIDCIIY